MSERACVRVGVVCVFVCLCKIYLKNWPVSGTLFHTNISFDVPIQDVSELQLSALSSLAGVADRNISAVTYIYIYIYIYIYTVRSGDISGLTNRMVQRTCFLYEFIC